MVCWEQLATLVCKNFWGLLTKSQDFKEHIKKTVLGSNALLKFHYIIMYLEKWHLCLSTGGQNQGQDSKNS